MDQIYLLAHKLLPSPDAFTVTDRQRASHNGFLVSPHPQRNFTWLQHLLPTYVFVPRGIARKFENLSPARFHVGRGQLPGTVTPFYTLFSPHRARTRVAARTMAAQHGWIDHRRNDYRRVNHRRVNHRRNDHRRVNHRRVNHRRVNHRRVSHRWVNHR